MSSRFSPHTQKTHRIQQYNAEQHPPELKPLGFSSNETPQRSAELYKMNVNCENAIRVWLTRDNLRKCGDVLRITNIKQL